MVPGGKAIWVIALSALMSVSASPTLRTRQSVKPLSQDEIDAYTLPYAYYAAAAYCEPAKTSAWDCGSTLSSVEVVVVR